FLYKTTNYYHPESECSILWSDQYINIEWPNVENIILSQKDRNADSLKLLVENKII
ncbi:dTDP-4-dehydrorhamnose 3,5-epimerase family protein, partial [Citrobacter freundii]|nr:dTDP-4-dehydrorhamnose 3,5-epimerase family protein [Citrobacter freundii]